MDHGAEVGIENLPLHRGGPKELRVVEGVEGLEAELQLPVFREPEIAQQGQIEVRLARPEERTP